MNDGDAIDWPVDKWLTAWEAAIILGVTDKCIEARRRNGKIEAIKQVRPIECVSSLGKIFTINKPVWVYNLKSIK